MTQTGITTKKISFYIHDSDYGGLIAKNGKIFWSYVKHKRKRNFYFSCIKEIIESWLVCINKFSWNIKETN